MVLIGTAGRLFCMSSATHVPNVIAGVLFALAWGHFTFGMIKADKCKEE
jgi:hypothetical protein